MSKFQFEEIPATRELPPRVRVTKRQRYSLDVAINRARPELYAVALMEQAVRAQIADMVATMVDPMGPCPDDRLDQIVDWAYERGLRASRKRIENLDKEMLDEAARLAREYEEVVRN